MIPVSIVIITKNEAEMIADCIIASKRLTDDIIIIDNGSTDGTCEIAAAQGCRVYQNSWKGYGANKNIGIELAKHEWIFSIDADEVPDRELIHSLQGLQLDDPAVVFDIRFKSYFGKKLIQYGSWGRGHHIRLFNRKLVRWSEKKVHEELILPKEIRKKRLKGYLHHYSVKDVQECKKKTVYYARLSAEKYFQEGREASFVSLFISPAFGFFKGYILLLGFLDGREGWDISRCTFRNKWMKYHCLNRMNRGQRKKTVADVGLKVEYEYLKSP